MTTSEPVVNKHNYYDTKMLSVSSVRLFAQNPARALDDWNDVTPWFEDQKALHLGSYLHSAMEDFIRGVDEDDPTSAFSSLKAELGEAMMTKPNKTHPEGTLRADFVKLNNLIDVMKHHPRVAWIKSQTFSPYTEVYVEEPYTGQIGGYTFKGRPDVFVVDPNEKIVHMFDYKTAAPLPVNGIGYYTDIHGERQYGNIAWSAEKMFPWQAGGYRELMRQNGYADYDFTYEYLVGTKQDDPRVMVFELPDDVMDEGLAQLTKATAEAYAYVSGEKTAEFMDDGSAWARRHTQTESDVVTVTVPVTQADGIQDVPNQFWGNLD